MINFDKIEETIIQNFKNGEGSAITRMANDGNVIINKLILKSGSSVGLHKHENNFEVVYVLKGIAEFIIDGKKETCKVGECHYCPKGSSHTFYPINCDEIIALCIVG